MRPSAPRRTGVRRFAATGTAVLGVLAAALTGALAPAAATAEPTWFQPGAVWTGDFGDPTVVRVGGTYYAYASPVGGRYLPVLTSTDLSTWRVHDRWSDAGPPGRAGYSAKQDPAIPAEIRASALDEWGVYDDNDALARAASWGVVHPQGPWIQRDYWAPGVSSIGSTWYAYSPVRVSPDRFCLTVASAPSPLGPFRDVSGAGPIQCQPAAVDPGGSIDPMPYHDAATGRDYLLWKASGKVADHPSAIMSTQLGGNGLPLPGAPVVKLLETDAASPWEGNTIENPSMVSYGGTTYLFYSGNLSDPLDAAGHSSYASGYAICPSGPTAPCTRAPARVPLLTSAGTAQGPGGSSGFVDASGRLRMAYATFRLGEDTGGAPLPRRMSIATLVQEPDRTLHVQGQAAPAAAMSSPSSITATWDALGGAGGELGAPTTPVLPTPTRAGSYQHFAGGSIYWSPATGAHVVKGAIRDTWARMGWETSLLGFPATDELTAPDRAGRFTHFQGGSVYWSPATGAHEVHGLVRDEWAATGYEAGPLGYPTTGELPTPDGRGRFNHFLRGSVYWSPATGAHEVQGAIRDAWAARGWETGRLGYPTSDEHAVAGQPGARRSDFTGGSVTWTPAGGAVVSLR